MAKRRETTERAASLLAAGPHSSQHSSPARPRPNAFTELMKPKKPRMDVPPTYDKARHDPASQQTQRYGRLALGQYALHPEAFPPSRVIYYDDKFVVINDMYPKSTVHLLILPRDKSKNLLGSQSAFGDSEFLADCKREKDKVSLMVADELRRRFGQYSTAEQARNEAMDAHEPPAELPPGRDWLQGVKSGIHATPSMDHLHIHVMSKDMVSDSLKNSSHYRSFTTDFFVALEEFPMTTDEYERKRRSISEKSMECWRCGQNFGNQLKKLKEHLDEELDAWKRE